MMHVGFRDPCENFWEMSALKKCFSNWLSTSKFKNCAGGYKWPHYKNWDKNCYLFSKLSMRNIGVRKKPKSCEEVLSNLRINSFSQQGYKSLTYRMNFSLKYGQRRNFENSNFHWWPFSSILEFIIRWAL